MKKFLILFLLSNLVLAQVEEIKYEVIYKSKFSEFALNKFKEDKRTNINREDFLQKTQNPKPSYYTLTNDKKSSKLVYESSINNEQNSNLEVNIKPFGSGPIYKFSSKDSINCYTEYPILGKNIFTKKELQKLIWTKINNDSIILNFNTRQYKAENQDATYTIWVTNQLPNNLGISDLFFQDGFILKIKITKKPTQVFDYEIIEAYPLSIKTKKVKNYKELELRNINIYSELQIKDMYKNFNSTPIQ